MLLYYTNRRHEDIYQIKFGDNGHNLLIRGDLLVLSGMNNTAISSEIIISQSKKLNHALPEMLMVNTLCIVFTLNT